jgi:hypothetical protein
MVLALAEVLTTVTVAEESPGAAEKPVEVF